MPQRRKVVDLERLCRGLGFRALGGGGRVVQGLHRDHGTRNGNYCVIIGHILGLHKTPAKQLKLLSRP